MKELTESQEAFVRYLVLEGCNQTKAAKRAGYADPSQRAYELVRKPHVMAAVREAQSRLIDGDLANIALKTLKEIMVDEGAIASARVSAARTTLDIGGYIKRGEEQEPHGKLCSEMTLEELDAEIAHLKRDRLTNKGAESHGGEPEPQIALGCVQSF